MKVKLVSIGSVRLMLVVMTVVTLLTLYNPEIATTLLPSYSTGISTPSTALITTITTTPLTYILSNNSAKGLEMHLLSPRNQKFTSKRKTHINKNILSDERISGIIRSGSNNQGNNTNYYNYRDQITENTTVKNNNKYTIFLSHDTTENVTYKIQLEKDDGKDALKDVFTSQLKLALRDGAQYLKGFIGLGNKKPQLFNTNSKDKSVNISNSEQKRGDRKRMVLDTMSYKIMSDLENLLQSTKLNGRGNETTNGGLDVNSIGNKTDRNINKPKSNLYQTKSKSKQITTVDETKRVITKTILTSNSTKHSKLQNCELRIELSGCECERTLTSRLPECPQPNWTQQQTLTYINTTLGESTCSDWATLRGANQSVLSYSLFGVFPSDYFRGAARLSASLPENYPGWSIRFYHDLDLARPHHKAWLCHLACQHPHLDFCSVDSLPAGLGDVRWSLGTVWRLGVMGDRLVDRYLQRDTDSPILQRELDAVAEWITSKKCFHIMRDSPSHDQEIMAGLWGGCGWWYTDATPHLRDQVFKWSPWATSPLSRDQINIVQLLWPVVRRNHLAHDSYWCSRFPDTQPFPTQRHNRTFVGMRSYRRGFQSDQTKQPCPVKCRPRAHKDWTYC